MLEAELMLLVKEFGCAELSVLWQPKTKDEKMFGKKGFCCGEVFAEDRLICVYVTDPTEALHVLRHEFFEAYFDKELLDGIITAYNNQRIAYERTMTKDLYKRKEAVIENMVKIVEFKRKAGDE